MDFSINFIAQKIFSFLRRLLNYEQKYIYIYIYIYIYTQNRIKRETYLNIFCHYIFGIDSLDVISKLKMYED